MGEHIKAVAHSSHLGEDRPAQRPIIDIQPSIRHSSSAKDGIKSNSYTGHSDPEEDKEPLFQAALEVDKDEKVDKQMKNNGRL